MAAEDRREGVAPRRGVAAGRLAEAEVVLRAAGPRGAAAGMGLRRMEERGTDIGRAAGEVAGGGRPW